MAAFSSPPSKLEMPTLEPTFEIVHSDAGGKGIRCKDCGLTSYNENDIKNKYCGNCHDFHELKMLKQRGAAIAKTGEELIDLIQKDIEKMEKDMKKWDYVFWFIKIFLTVGMTAGYLLNFTFVQHWLGIEIYADNVPPLAALGFSFAIGGGWGYFMSNTWLIPYFEKKRKKKEDEFRKALQENRNPFSN
jgi:ribosomal protein L37E